MANVDGGDGEVSAGEMAKSASVDAAVVVVSVIVVDDDNTAREISADMLLM